MREYRSRARVSSARGKGAAEARLYILYVKPAYLDKVTDKAVPYYGSAKKLRRGAFVERVVDNDEWIALEMEMALEGRRI